jgi:hypothetical protein
MTAQPVGLDDLIQFARARSPDGDALTHLQDAMLVSQQLSDQADHLIGHFVDQARRAGASWSAIGEAMGVTKQAAQKRFVPSLAGIDLPGPPLTRFTPRARGTLTAAQDEARRAAAGQVGPEHLLLGLLAEPEGLAAKAIGALGVTPEQVRAQAGIAPAGSDAGAGAAAGERIPFAPRAKTVLELTLREALLLGHNYIGTEHLLLGVLAEGGAGAQVLTGLGITEDRAREWVTRAIAEMMAARAGGKEAGA